MEDWRRAAAEVYPKVAELPAQPRCYCGQPATWKCKSCGRYYCDSCAVAAPLTSTRCVVLALERVA